MPRALFARLMLLPMARKLRWSPRLIPMVLLFAVMNLTFLSAITRVEATMTIWLQYTAPMWVFLVGVCWFKKPVDPRDGGMLVRPVESHHVGSHRSTYRSLECRWRRLGCDVCCQLCGDQ